MLPGAARAEPTATPDGDILRDAIDGAVSRAVPNIVTRSGITRGVLQVHLLSPMRPTLVTVPPGVWHGLQNLEASPAVFVSVFDRVYRHDDPDEWRLPVDTDAIPFRF